MRTDYKNEKKSLPRRRTTKKHTLKIALVLVSFGDSVKVALDKTIESFSLDMSEAGVLAKELNVLFPNSIR